MSDRLLRVAGAALAAAATAIVIVALAIIPFLNPAWVAFEQGRAEATAWTGFREAELRRVTDAILADLVVGPPAFDVEFGGQPVLNERERGHMADVRGVFVGLAVLAVVSVVVLGAALRLVRPPAAVWKAIRAGAVALSVGVVVVGVVGLVAFEAAFEVFHRLFFAGGTYTFDPSTERLVQLFPQRFWFETALAVGIAILLLAAGTTWVATRRVRSEHRAPVLAVTTNPEPAR